MPCCGKPAQAASSEGFPNNADKVIILTRWHETTGMDDKMTTVENPNPRLRVVLPCLFTRRIPYRNPAAQYPASEILKSVLRDFRSYADQDGDKRR